MQMASISEEGCDGERIQDFVLIPYASEGRMLEVARRTVRIVWRTLGERKATTRCNW